MPIADRTRYADALRVDRELVAVLDSNRHRAPHVVAECERDTLHTRRREFRTRTQWVPAKVPRDTSVWHATQIDWARRRIARLEAILALPPLTDLAHNDWRKREAAQNRALDRERSRRIAEIELPAARARLAWLEERHTTTPPTQEDTP